MKWLVLLAAVVLVTPWCRAETGGERVFRLAQIAASRAALDYTHEVTVPELAKLGFVEGKNLVMLDRFGEYAELPRLVHDVLEAKVDAIITFGGEILLAASLGTKTVPIVSYGPDPTQMGLAASLARPGGNVTGVVLLASELDPKRLDVLHESVPAARRIAALVPSLSPGRAVTERELRKFASNSGIALQIIFAAGPEDYPAAFAAMRAGDAQALVLGTYEKFFMDGRRLAALALEARLPVMCEWPDMVELGCMLGYGPDRAELRRRLAHYIAQIFRGVSPANLPIERPARFKFAINLRVARTLGITIPSDLLTLADQVIE